MQRMEVEYEVDVRSDKTLLDDDELERVLYASDEDSDYPDSVIDLPHYPDFLDITKPSKVTESEKQKKVHEYLKKSVLVPDFEKQKAIPLPKASQRALRLERKKEREKTKGPGWFNISMPEMTEEVKNDIALLKRRAVLDPKHKYKNNDLSHVPKYFQIGTVLETPADFYSSRIPKAQRKRTLVDELLADVESRALQKKKFKAVLDSSRQKGRKPNHKPRHSKKKTG